MPAEQYWEVPVFDGAVSPAYERSLKELEQVRAIAHSPTTQTYELSKLDRKESDLIIADIQMFAIAAYYAKACHHVELVCHREFAEGYGDEDQIDSLLYHLRTARHLMNKPGARNRLAIGYSKTIASPGPLPPLLIKAQANVLFEEVMGASDEDKFATSLREYQRNPLVFARSLLAFEAVLEAAKFNARRFQVKNNYSLVALPFLTYWYIAKGSLPKISRGNGGHSAAVRFVQGCFDLIGVGASPDQIEAVHKDGLETAIDKCRTTLIASKQTIADQRSLMLSNTLAEIDAWGWCGDYITP